MTFLAEFLAGRRPAVATGCAHLPVSFAFEVEDAAGTDEFSVLFRDGQAFVDDARGGAPTHRVTCTAAELRDVVEGRCELLGPFWAKHLPLEFSWAPLLYAFFFPNHPYLRLNPVLRALYQEPRYYPTITPFTQGHRLYELVRAHRLERTLEIGLAFGGSALFLAQAHHDARRGHHFAADPFQASLYGNRALAFVEQAGLRAFFTCLPVRGREAFAGFAGERTPFDLVYIDGEHGPQSVLRDFLGANRILREGGLLAFDDSHFPSGRLVLRQIGTHFPYRLLTEHCTDRFKVLRKEGHREAPALVRAAAMLGHSGLVMRALLKAAGP